MDVPASDFVAVRVNEPAARATAPFGFGLSWRALSAAVTAAVVPS